MFIELTSSNNGKNFTLNAMYILEVSEKVEEDGAVGCVIWTALRNEMNRDRFYEVQETREEVILKIKEAIKFAENFR